jgi:hypothetical protein
VTANTYSLLPAAGVPPWQTTDGLGQIELWGTGFLGVPAFEGNAFAEINANTAGTLYQDVVSTPGSTLTWTLVHRARQGDDTMVVLIGDANVADVTGSAGWDYTSAGLTDGVDAWGTHSDSFVVPAGQTCTRLAFRAVSTGSGDDSIGNFLDAVDFTVTVPPPPPPPPPDPDDPPAPLPTDAPAPIPTPPPTDTTALAPRSSATDAGVAAAMAILGAAGALAVTLRRRTEVRR